MYFYANSREASFAGNDRLFCRSTLPSENKQTRTAAHNFPCQARFVYAKRITGYAGDPNLPHLPLTTTDLASWESGPLSHLGHAKTSVL